MAATVLVTGGTGYVAGWCIVGLLEQGHTVRATLRSTAKESALRATIAKLVDPEDRLSFVIADLLSDEGWDAAVAGCDYVLHVASPLGSDSPRDKDALIAPARDGTLRVLGAAARAGVQRVVMTSACAAATPLMASADSGTDETIWTDPNDPDLTAYRKSKVVAEKSAWDFMRDNGGTTEFTTVLPGAVFGPLQSPDTVGSVQVIARLMEGKMPGNPRLGFEVVDVRDLAEAHIRAMTAPAAGGERIIAAGEFMWTDDVSTALKDKMGDAASKVPTRKIPNFVMRGLALFDGEVRSLTPALGRRHEHSSAKAKRLLDWQARPGAETVVACGESLITNGVIQQ